MPTYQYACTNPETKHEFEVVQSFTDPAVAVCPECGAPVRKVYGSVGVVFKGSGFYRTDSRDSGAKASSSTTKESGSKDSGSSSGKDAGTSSGNTSGTSSSGSSDSSGSSGSSKSGSSSSGSSGSGSGSSSGSGGSKAAPSS